MSKIYFSRVKDDAVIPSKEGEDGGYDLYASFDKDYMRISPGETKLIPTGIASAFSKDFVMIVKERSSTGIKNMGVRAGVVDSGYRGEWFVAINNTGKKDIVIAKFPHDFEDDEEDVITHSYADAIAQAIKVKIGSNDEVEVISYEDLRKIESKRKTGTLGSSGK